MKRFLATSIVTVGLCTIAHADDGDIVFTDQLTGTINMVNAPLDTSVLHTFQGNTRIADIIRIGNNWYVGDGPRPEDNPSPGKMWKVTDLFGSPSDSIHSNSDPVQNPIGMIYDRASDHIITVNNPVSNQLPNHFDGILGVDRVSGNAVEIFEEPPAGSRPRYRAGVRLAPDRNSDDYFVSVLNGGIQTGADDFDFGSVIYRLDLDRNTMTGDVEMVVDLSDTNVTGLSRGLTFTRGIVTLPGSNDMYVVDGGIGDDVSGSIWKISLDGNGDFSGIESVLDSSSVLMGRLSELTWNPFTNKLVFSEEEFDGGLGRVMQVNLDGTGFEILAEGVNARGIAIVPAPATLALVGLAMAARRRRA